MLRRLHVFFIALSVVLCAALPFGDSLIAATRPIAFVPTGTGVVKVSSGSESSAASAVGLASADVSGTLGVANGGTGATTLTANSVILGNGSSAVGFVAPGSNGNFLRSNGTTWTSTSLANGLTSYGAFASRPAAGNAGARYVTSDCQTEWIDDGTEWRPLINGRIGKQPPSYATFTQFTAGSITGTTFADECGSIAIHWTNLSSGGEFTRALFRTKPSSGASGYYVTIHVRVLNASENNGSFLVGGGWRQSSDGRLELIDQAFATNSSFQTQFHWIRYTASSTATNATLTFNSQTTAAVNALDWSAGMWIRWKHNTTNGNRDLYWSHDGVTFSINANLSSTANAFLTPDQVLLECWNSNTTTGPITNVKGCWFDSYEETQF